MINASKIASLILCLAISFSVHGETNSWLKPVKSELLEDTPWHDAAHKYDLDPWLLFAISLEESGEFDHKRGVLAPWPYVTHHAGSVIHHETLDDAMKQVALWESEGTTNYDVGPFQINRRWHGGNFSNIEDMFDVEISAKYAAMLLRNSIKRSAGDVFTGVGLYRSWTDEQEAELW